MRKNFLLIDSLKMFLVYLNIFLCKGTNCVSKGGIFHLKYGESLSFSNFHDNGYATFVCMCMHMYTFTLHQILSRPEQGKSQAHSLP